MMKYLTQCLAVFLLLLAVSLSGQDVEISMDHPDVVNAGEDFEVTITIKKGALKDYSRFSQDLPPGLSASNLSSPNADFSFDEQRVRIIWLKLPDGDEVKVSYQVSVDARLKGQVKLGGVFAYVVNDERKFLTFDQQPFIRIVPNPSMNPSMVVDIKDFKGGAAPVVPATAPAEVEGFAMAVRQKPELLNSGAYRIHLLIKNPGGSRYAKVEETIPEGYTFEEVESSGGIVSFAASTVKLIWMSMPSQPEFEVVYHLVPLQDKTQGTMAVDGLLTYTSASENRVVEIVEVDASLDDLSAAQKKDLLATGNIPPSARISTSSRRETRTTPPARTETRTTPPARTETRPMEQSSSGMIANTKVLDPGTGTYFRVQITANRTAFDATSFYRQAGLTREVLVEQHNGYYKYTVGPFQTYEEALEYVEQANSLQEVEGAFVVGYRNGNRVSAAAIR